MNQAVAIRIQGTIQGVGFRPFIWQLAKRYQLCGDVCNDGSGVLIRAYPIPDLQRFTQDLRMHAPPLSDVQNVGWQFFHWHQPPPNFSIRASCLDGSQTAIAPDAATCPECLAEIFSPTSHRYRYPFTTCTHCGPRFSVIEALPYDRERTTLHEFPLCSDCLSEYHSPDNRRFHAESTACPDCGPKLIWLDHSPHVRHLDPLATALATLQEGKIILLKGLGGFHLVCDATNEQTLATLRQRKQRVSKPFALMVPNHQWLAKLVVPEQLAVAHRLLSSSAAPIGLFRRRIDAPIASLVAPRLDELGLIYPSNPLHHLIAREFNRPLVLTSANQSALAPMLDDEHVWETLGPLVDGMLGHNRKIVTRVDDSLLRLDHQQQAVLLRRSRGYVPQSSLMDEVLMLAAPLLAMGADLKNTFALARNREVILSAHFGDLTSLSVQNQYQQAIEHYLKLYQLHPEHIVIDAHPGYYSHQIGRMLAEQLNAQVVKVYHHHAHVAAAMVEAQVKANQQVVGICLDGLGMGPNGTWWGGECLVADYQSFEHVGGLPAVALPGANLAARQPWRNLLAQWLAFVPNWSERWPNDLADCPVQPLSAAIARQVNSPLASSAGRLFDAVAAYLGCSPRVLDYEGQAAISLEQLAMQVSSLPTSLTMALVPCGDQYYLDMTDFWQQWLSVKGSRAQKAWLFHDALANGFAQLALKVADARRIETIVLCGGVMNNLLLRSRFEYYLKSKRVICARQYPCGDGGLALGQAAIGAAQLQI
ncbi:carbamoyltransferase HypF [Celerinatantimonas diazotrophica]|uniref:Carbamoyltransferase HypF n=1 Tax=Celerinatantimonas diazotrophica TaxID=412034 RepID=A0A4R1K9Q3_9GAMM|nr:carbamoyltransferase HypF [Celerinatantimonas diazotrophica]TCK61122.1 hydrogenase maturation carbamoyltransferase HypF [Celerinatantimonas diazotrophica]CAG9295171.1 Carbamoyltransferase HypF [Celerinatantimonas diazotrophica]